MCMQHDMNCFTEQVGKLIQLKLSGSCDIAFTKLWL